MMIPMANSFPKKKAFWTKVAHLTLMQLMKVTTATGAEKRGMFLFFHFFLSWRTSKQPGIKGTNTRGGKNKPASGI